MSNKGNFKKKTVKRLARRARVPPGRVMVSKKEKLARRRRTDWRRELVESKIENSGRDQGRGG